MLCNRLVVVLLFITKVQLISAEVPQTFAHFNLSKADSYSVSIAAKACEIATNEDAWVNLVYTSMPQNYLERQVLDCMSELPIYSLQLHQFDLEPRRDYGTLSVFILAELNGTAALAQLQRIASILNANQHQKHYHKYIFVWSNAPLPLLRNLFKAVWHKRILHAIAITSAEMVYTFEPFTAAGFTVNQLKHEPYFYDKLKNLHRYQLRISMFRDFIRAIPKESPEAGYIGVDGLMASSIVTHLNATVKYVAPMDNENYGACLENGTFTGVLRDLLADTTHVNFNAQFVLPCVAQHIETLYPFFKRILYVVVPAAEMFPAYLIFIYACEDGLWQTLVVFFFLIVAAFALLKYYSESRRNVEKMKNGRWYDLIELFWKTQLGVPVNSFSNTNALRQFLMAWILFNYVLSTIYFAKVESIFVHPTYYPEMDRLDDLDKLNVPIFGVRNIFTAVQPALKPHHWRAIAQRAVQLPLHFSSFQFAVAVSERKHSHVAFLLRAETAKDLLVKTYDVERHRPRFHVVKERLVTMPQTYLLAKGSPFRFKFQQFESQVFECGLFDYWAVQSIAQHNVRSPSSLEEFRNDLPEGIDFEAEVIDEDSGVDEVKRKVVLNLSILQGPFYLWGFGILFSFVAFMVEQIFWWYCKSSIIVV